MALASYASLVLCRFESLREAGSTRRPDDPGTLFHEVGADLRAANTVGRSWDAYKFVMFGLHDSAESAHRVVAARTELAPWIQEATEVWAGVIQPFRHLGQANFSDPAQPGPQYQGVAEVPPPDEPVVIMTSAGFDASTGIDQERVSVFGQGVTSVRVSMTGNPGMHSQQSFFFNSASGLDGITLTFWSDLATAMAFAYGPGLHRDLMKAHKEVPFVDRTSFTRFRRVWSDGVWHGSDPLLTRD